jgi:hypothetical protein
MVRKSGADDPDMVVSSTASTRATAAHSKDKQGAVVTTFGLERRAGWNVARRAVRPINLERRARFARIEA